MDGFDGLDSDVGIPSEETYLAAYCRRTGRSGIPDWSFYVAFALFRLAAIAQGIMGRVIAGTANDPNARQRGERARPLADAAWALISSRRASGAIGRTRRLHGRSPRRHSRRRSDPERGRPLWHADPRRHGRPGGQGGAAGPRRRRARLGPALLGPGERVLHERQPQQAERGRRHEDARRARDHRAPHRPRGRPRAVAASRRPRRARPRLGARASHQSAPHLLLDHRLRHGRAVS